MPGKGHTPDQILRKLRQFESNDLGMIWEYFSGNTFISKNINEREKAHIELKVSDLRPEPVPLAMLVRRPASALLSPAPAAGIRVNCAAESCCTPAATVLSVSAPHSTSR